MSLSDQIGIRGEQEFTVGGVLLTDVGGTIDANVLSTPAMIGMMEHTSTVLVAEHLDPGKATVGFEVCVKHVAGAPEGAELVARSRLVEVVEERKLRFEVEVTDGDRTIGVGRHERRVIEVSGGGSA